MINKDLNGKRVIVGMSGGVDSSVAAMLLKEAGANVIGVMIRLYSCNKPSSKQSCCSGADQQDAFLICEQIGIPFHLIDLSSTFQREVIDYFVDGYKRGHTPNPCVKCNETTKFTAFKKALDQQFDYDYIAMGHYARVQKIETGEDGRFHLYKGRDFRKDQSYFLWTLSQEMLSKVLFPLGDMTKEEVRAIANRVGLKTAKKQESQDICFVPDGDYAGFIADYFPEEMGKPGHFVDKNGRQMGRHRGIHAYTIGMRRGLGVGFGQRKYVVDINSSTNQITLGEQCDLMSSSCRVKGVNWIRSDYESFTSISAKVRYGHRGAFVTIERHPDGHFHVFFREPQRAVTPGQAIVFYQDDEVLGGGWITA